MHWQKLHKVFVADGLSPALNSHAANPVALVQGNTIRIYYNGRDSKQRTSISYIDCVIENDICTIFDVCKSPILQPGTPGLFDDSGVSLGNIVVDNGVYWLFYMGWNLTQTVPWRNSIGLATSSDGVNFEKVSLAPILDRSKHDLYTISYPWVMKKNGKWLMWYGSNLSWGANKDAMQHVIKVATSKNGTDWTTRPDISVDLQSSSEIGLSKPCVLFEDNQFKMWYALRKKDYRIGYAESKDGFKFERKDNLVGIDVTKNSWDSNSICYPNVFDYKNERYMLYCGNGYGKTGFGIAKMV